MCITGRHVTTTVTNMIQHLLYLGVMKYDPLIALELVTTRTVFKNVAPKGKLKPFTALYLVEGHPA